MNEQNYASLEASQRLINAGIVLETENVWSLNVKWKLGRRDWVEHMETCFDIISAPSMAEVWRELPEQVIVYHGNTLTEAYNTQKTISFVNKNPTDALIDLLIWVKKPEV